MTFQPCRASAISAKWSSRAARRGRAEKADKSSIGPSRIIGPKESFLFLPPEVIDSPSSQKTALTSPRRPAGRSPMLDFNPTRSYLTDPEDVQEMRGFTGA